MKAKEFIPASKPRNFVAKNAPKSGAGRHSNEKQAKKQGKVKHKNKQYDEGVSEGIRVVDQDYDLDQIILTLDIEGRRASFTYTDYDENFENAERRDVFDQLQEKSWYKDLDHPTKMEILDAAYKAIRGEEPSEYKPRVDDEPLDIDEGAEEDPSEEEMDRTVSDLHKDVFGIRPSPEWGREWMSMSEQEKRDLYYQMVDMLDQQQDMSEGYGNKEFEVDGYTYMTDLDREEDNQKIWHMIKTPDGKTVDVDFTPYEYMTKDDVELYVKLDMPRRQGGGPLDSKQLQKMAQIKGVAMLDPKMARAGMKKESVAASPRLQRAHEKERQRRGLPHPDEYLRMIEKKKKEIAAMRAQDLKKDVKEASDFGEPKEILADVLDTLEREVEWPLTEVMDYEEVLRLLAPIKNAVNQRLKTMDKDVSEAGDDWGSMSHREFKRRELEQELGHENDPDFERKMMQKQMDKDKGPWYIRIDGKIYKQKGEPKVFDWRKGANNYALAMVKNRPELKDKIMLTRKPVDESSEIPFTECPECRGPIFHESLVNEKQDACYHKVRSRYKVWPSAYASGALVQCRKKGAANWGDKSKK